MRDQRWLLVDKQVHQASQHGCSAVDARVFPSTLGSDQNNAILPNLADVASVVSFHIGLKSLSWRWVSSDTCFREGRRIPWESGITVVTPLNRNRWNLITEAIQSFQKQHGAQLWIFISEHTWKGGQPTEEEASMILNQGDESSVPVPAVFMFVPSMPVVVNRNTYQGLKLVNGARYTALEVILDKKHPGHRISVNTILHFGPPAGILLASETTKDLHLVGMPAGVILLAPMSTKMECVRKRPWQQNDVTRRGLPCTAAFACTDYKVQGRTSERVALELRGTRTMNIEGQRTPSQCDPYSLYVQLSRCRSQSGIMLLSKVRERDVVGNTVPESMAEAENRLEELSEATIREMVEKENWEDWSNAAEADGEEASFQL